MLVIGLTGGIGSGKSTIASMFAKRGVPIVDADTIAREIVQPGTAALDEIVRHFGAEILDENGNLNRPLLRDIIFQNTESRTELEHILHPIIRDEIGIQLEKISASYCILVVPLLIDTGNWDAVDRILVVDSDEEIQIQRVTERDQQSRRQIVAILDSQIGRDERLASADDIIENHSSLGVLEIRVEQLHQFYMTLSQNEPQETNHPASASASAETSPGADDLNISYEQPLNERYRTFLKLESLFQRIHYHIKGNTKWDSYALMAALIEILNLTARGDLRSDVIKEVERLHASLKRHESLLSINQQYLASLLDQLQILLRNLHDMGNHANEHLKVHPLLNIVRQRINIPGGASDFDIPAYCHWLNQPADIRRSQYESWLSPFMLLEQAIVKCLGTVRASAERETHTAEGGFYQQNLNSGRDIQLIRVITERHRPYYPEISAGRHRFSIRFFEQAKSESKSQQCQENIPFSLAICGI